MTGNFPTRVNTHEVKITLGVSSGRESDGTSSVRRHEISLMVIVEHLYETNKFKGHFRKISRSSSSEKGERTQCVRNPVRKRKYCFNLTTERTPSKIIRRGQ